MQSFLETVGHFTGGPANALVILLALLKIGLLLGGTLGIIPFIILFERKIISWVQDRPGPNRVGPWGAFQGIVDGVKLFFKEEIMPRGVDRPLYLLAPMLIIVPAFLALALVPIGPMIQGTHLAALADWLDLDPEILGPFGIIQSIPLAVTNPNIGILYVLAITSVGVYGITLAGWSSNNKWSLLGGIRASAQMVSYEITLSLSIIGVILISGSLNLYDIINQQTGGMWWWNVVAQPMAFCLFIIAMFAETNRLPFDLAEAEPELTGGFHTEYSSMRFALFFMGEYVNMITVSAMCTTLFLGGFTGFFPLDWAWLESQIGWLAVVAYYAGGPLLLFPMKIAFFIVFFIFVRAALPRLRYDQLMNVGWTWMLWLGVANLMVTAVAVAIGLTMVQSVTELPWGFGTIERLPWVVKLGMGVVTLAILLGADWFITSRKHRDITSKYRNISYGRKKLEAASEH